jgi:hypothetical protein
MRQVLRATRCATLRFREAHEIAAFVMALPWPGERLTRRPYRGLAAGGAIACGHPSCFARGRSPQCTRVS